VRQELHPAITLALIGLETHGQTTESGADLLGIVRGEAGVGILDRGWAGHIAPEQKRATEKQQCKDDRRPPAHKNCPHPTAIDHYEPSEFPVSWRKY
jgi:hypothetical protein